MSETNEIRYKAALPHHIIILKLLEDSIITEYEGMPLDTKLKTNKIFVEDIIDIRTNISEPAGFTVKSFFDPKFIYEKGKEIEIENFDINSREGIYYFIDRESAEIWGESQSSDIDQTFNIHNPNELVIYKKYFSDGTTRLEGYKLNKKRHSSFKFYWRNGNLKAEGNYNENKKNGHWIYYYNSGNKRREGHFVDNKRVGNWKVYKDSDQEIILKSLDMEENVKNNECYYYFDNGKLKKLITYNHGVREGHFEKYRFTETGFDDDKMYDGNYLNNKKTDYWIHYRKNTDYSEIHYKENKRDGDWCLKNKDGILRKEKHYKDGKKEGSYMSYFQSTRKREEGEYIENKKEGVWKVFKDNENNDIQTELIYKNGKFVYLQTNINEETNENENNSSSSIKYGVEYNHYGYDKDSESSSDGSSSDSDESE